MAVVHVPALRKPAFLNPIQQAIDAGTENGYIQIYSGSMPTTADTAVTNQVLLATLKFSKPCGAVVDGVLTMSAITQDEAADATGTATWARIKGGDDGTVMDIDVSIVGGTGALQLNTTSIVAGGPVFITSFVISIP